VSSREYEHLSREVLFEYMPVGKSVKVSAIDPVTGIEVSIVGPVTASTLELKRIAMAKLNYVIGKKKEEGRR